MSASSAIPPSSVPPSSVAKVSSRISIKAATCVTNSVKCSLVVLMSAQDPFVCTMEIALGCFLQHRFQCGCRCRLGVRGGWLAGKPEDPHCLHEPPGIVQQTRGLDVLFFELLSGPQRALHNLPSTGAQLITDFCLVLRAFGDLPYRGNQLRGGLLGDPHLLAGLLRQVTAFDDLTDHRIHGGHSVHSFGLDVVHQVGDLLGGLAGVLSQALHFLGYHRETSASFTS